VDRDPTSGRFRSIPQYTAMQYLRVAHGLLIDSGCLVIARQLQREQFRRSFTTKVDRSTGLAS
jgi:hypothetical protein